jgi:hypothetical protein
MRYHHFYYWLLAFVIFDLMMISLHLYFVPQSYFSDLFDLDKEANFPTWYTSFKLTLAGVMALLVYIKENSTPRVYTNAWLWLLIAVLMFFMSADETAQIHEMLTRWFMQTIAGARLRQSFDIGVSGGTLLWGLIFSPLLLLIAASLISFYSIRFKEHSRLFKLSILMIVFFITSFLLEQQEAHIAGQLEQITSEQLTRYKYMTIIEESCELLGSSLLFLIHFCYYQYSHE